MSLPTVTKPGIVVFDLDFTIWPYWADSHLSAPFHKDRQGNVLDNRKQRVDIYPGVREILELLKSNDVTMAIASKSPQRDMYINLLELLDLKHYFVQFELYRKSKRNHLTAISTEQDIAFKDMVFFDDEYNNISDTKAMGVTAIHCPQRQGIKMEHLIDGFKKYEAFSKSKMYTNLKV